MNKTLDRSRYVVDIYSDSVYSDDSVNVNAVCSPRFLRNGDRIEVEVDFHNGWFFHSERWCRASSPERVAWQVDQLIRELSRVANSPGRAGMTRLPDDSWNSAGPPLS
jgi:hypothetical protein